MLCWIWKRLILLYVFLSVTRSHRVHSHHPTKMLPITVSKLTVHVCLCVCVTAALGACVYSYLKSMEHSRLRLNAKVGIREESRTLNPRNQLSMWPLTSIFRDTAMAQCWQVNSVWVMEVSPDKLGLHLMPFRVTHVMFCAVSHRPRFFDRWNILWQTASCTTTLYVLGALKTNWCVSILEMGFMAVENLEKPFLSKSYLKTGSLLYFLGYNQG